MSKPDLATKRTNAADDPNDLPNIGKVARRELALAGYTRMEHFTRVSETELLKIHGVGRKALQILKNALEKDGLTFLKQ